MRFHFSFLKISEAFHQKTIENIFSLFFNECFNVTMNMTDG